MRSTIYISLLLSIISCSSIKSRICSENAYLIDSNTQENLIVLGGEYGEQTSGIVIYQDKKNRTELTIPGFVLNVEVIENKVCGVFSEQAIIKLFTYDMNLKSLNFKLANIEGTKHNIYQSIYKKDSVYFVKLHDNKIYYQKDEYFEFDSLNNIVALKLIDCENYFLDLNKTNGQVNILKGIDSLERVYSFSTDGIKISTLGNWRFDLHKNRLVVLYSLGNETKIWDLNNNEKPKVFTLNKVVCEVKLIDNDIYYTYFEDLTRIEKGGNATKPYNKIIFGIDVLKTH
jgi:hypothetical protein